MKKAMFPCLLLACSLVMSSCALGAASSTEQHQPPAASGSGSASTSADDSYFQTLSEFHSIEIDVLAADVQIIAGEEWSISYHISNQEPLERFGVEDGTLYVDTVAPARETLNPNETYFITVTVPEGAYLSEVSVDVLAGDIDIQNLTCHSASLYSTSGSVAADGIVAWDMELEAVFGTLNGTNLSSDKVSAETCTGSIHLDGSFDTLETSTNSGSTEVNGSIGLDGSLESTSGSIDLSLSHSAALTVHRAGSITLNDAPADVPLRTKGAVPVSLESVSGDLVIQTADE